MSCLSQRSAARMGTCPEQLHTHLSLLAVAFLAAALSAAEVAVLWSPSAPDTLPLTEYPPALYVLWFSMSLLVRLAVWKLFFFPSMAACVLLITPPLRFVWPWTFTSKPWAPALMPDCSVTLA